MRFRAEQQALFSRRGLGGGCADARRRAALNRRLLVIASVLASGCLDFDQALALCAQDGGRCVVPVADAGPRVVSDSGTDGGGLIVVGRDAGPALDAGIAEDAGTRTPGPDAGVGLDAGIAEDAGTRTPAPDAGVGLDASVDAGTPCAGGCVRNGTCVLPPSSRDDFSCGSTGAACFDCGSAGQVCGSGGTAACVAGPIWRKAYTLGAGTPMGPVEVRSIWANAPNEAWFANANTSFAHISGMTVTAGELDSQLTTVMTTGDAGAATIYVGGVNGGFGFARVFHEPWVGTNYSPGIMTAFSDYSPPLLRDIWALFAAGPEVFALGDDMNSHLALLRAQPDGGWLMVTPLDAGTAPGWATELPENAAGSCALY